MPSASVIQLLGRNQAGSDHEAAKELLWFKEACKCATCKLNAGMHEHVVRAMPSRVVMQPPLKDASSACLSIQVKFKRKGVAEQMHVDNSINVYQYR